MNALQKRPLAAGCTAFLLSVWAFLTFLGDFRGEAALVGLFAAVAGTVFCAILHKSRAVPLALFLPIALGAGLTFLTVDLPTTQLSGILADGEIHLAQVRCEEVGFAADYAAEHRVRVLALDGTPLDADAILICTHELDLSAGDVIEIGVSGGADGSGEHAFSQEYGACPTLLSEEMDARYLTLADEKPWETLSRWLRTWMERSLSEESAGLLTALLLGNRSTLPDDLSLVFRNLGISHVLSVSGLHLTMVLFGLEWLLKRLTAPRWLRDLCAIAGAAGYAMLTGMSASVLRAGGMLLLTRLASRVGRESDPATNLATALTVVTLISPYSVLDVGLQLSAASTAGILLVSAVRRRWDQADSPIRSAAAVSLGALAATLPLSLYLFGTVSLMAIPANLLLSLPVSLCMAGGIAFLLVGRVPGIGNVAAFLAENASKLLLGSARLLDGGRNYLLAPGTPTVLIAIAAALLCAILVRKRVRLRRILPAALSVLLVYAGTGVELLVRAPDARITFLSDGSDDGLIVSQDGMTLLCDFSDGSFDPMSAQTETALRRHGCASPDGYLLSHYHQRSASTVRRLLRQTRLGMLLLPYPQTDTERALADRMAQTAAAWGTETVYYASDGASAVKVGQIELRIWKASLKRSTHPTLRVQMTCRGRTVGYLGASVQESEPAILSEWLPYCDILLLGSHGPVIKQPLPPCGEVICADALTAEALGMTDAHILTGFDDFYTVIIPEKGGISR